MLHLHHSCHDSIGWWSIFEKRRPPRHGNLSYWADPRGFARSGCGSTQTSCRVKRTYGETKMMKEQDIWLCMHCILWYLILWTLDFYRNVFGMRMNNHHHCDHDHDHNQLSWPTITIIFILTRLVDCGHASPSPASPMVIMMITDQSYSDCVDDGLMIDLKSEN